MTDRLVRLVRNVCPAGYKIAKVDNQPGTGGASMFGVGVRDIIVPLGGERRTYEARLLEHEIFRHLANSARRPGSAGVLEFVNKWGLLGNEGGRESLERFLSRRDLLLEFMSAKQKSDFSSRLRRELRGAMGPWPNLGPLYTQLVFKRGRPRIFLQASSLLQFCFLEFLHAIDGNVDLTSCDACGELLPIHRQGRPKRYCDDACKMAAWRAKHGDVINRRRRESRAERRAS
jgi:hypothetical protein